MATITLDEDRLRLELTTAEKVLGLLRDAGPDELLVSTPDAEVLARDLAA